MLMISSIMNGSKDGNNNLPPLEPNVVIHDMIDPRRTPVYVDGRIDEDNEPFISAGMKKRKKKIAADRMMLSDGDDFFSDCSSNSGSKIPGKRTCVSLSDGGGEYGNENFLYNGNDQPNARGNLDARPLIIIRCTGEGSFGNPSKTLKWFNESVFVKKLVGQITVPGRLASSIQFRVVNLEGLGRVKDLKKFGPLDVEVIVKDSSKPVKGKILQGVISPISVDVEDNEIMSNLTRCNNDLKIVLVKRIVTKQKTECIRVNFEMNDRGLLPKSVRWDFQSYRVRLYHPVPLRCYRCQQYGHGISSCNNKKICGACSGDHTLRECDKSRDPICYHCGMGHITGNIRCRYTARAQKIEDEKAAGNLSYDLYVKNYKILNDTIRGLVSESRGRELLRREVCRAGDNAAEVGVGNTVERNLQRAQEPGVNGPTWASVVKSPLAPGSTSLGSRGPGSKLRSKDQSLSLDSEGVGVQPPSLVGSPTGSLAQPQPARSRSGRSNSKTFRDLSLGEIIMPLLPDILMIVNDSNLSLLESFIKICKLFLDSCSSYSSS